MVLLQRKLYFSKDRGGPTFLKGGWGGGGSRIQVLISIETHITCVRTPYPPPPSGSAHGLIAG